MRFRRTYRLVFAVALLTLAAAAAKPIAKWIDLHWAGGMLKDTWGALRWHEDWRAATPLPTDSDAAWLYAASRPIRIAHAIGASGTTAANTLGAVLPAVHDGFKLFEVDLWLDTRGELRCQHDDATATPLGEGECTLARLLPRVAELNGWVILDIKSDFAATGDAVMKLVVQNKLASHVVFQLYRADQLALFGKWARQAPLPLPIVTTYASHRSVQHIADQAKVLNIRVLTLPLEDAQMLHERPPGVAVLVHPVHNCIDWRHASAAHFDGIYANTALACGAWTTPTPNP